MTEQQQAPDESRSGSSEEPVAPASYPDALVEEATTACSAAQRSVCDLPTQRTPELDQALQRRVELTLAGSDGKTIRRRLGGGDDEVRRLEAPYTKRRAPEHDEHKTSGRRRRRRSTPKERE